MFGRNFIAKRAEIFFEHNTKTRLKLILYRYGESGKNESIPLSYAVNDSVYF